MTHAQPRRLTGDLFIDVAGALGEHPQDYYLASDIDPLLQELVRLRERVAGMEANDRRYKFLRAGGPGTGLYVADSGNSWNIVKDEQLDAAIDSATGGG